MRRKQVTRSEIRCSVYGWHGTIHALPLDACREKVKATVGDWQWIVYEPTAALFTNVVAELSAQWKVEAKRAIEMFGHLPEPLQHQPRVMPTTWLAAEYQGPHECAQCGRWFVHHHIDHQSRPGRFCSDACAAVAHKASVAATQARVVEQRSAARAERRAGLKCENCGEPLEAARSTARFCSTKCRMAAHRRRGARRKA